MFDVLIFPVAVTQTMIYSLIVHIVCSMYVADLLRNSYIYIFKLFYSSFLFFYSLFFIFYKTGMPFLGNPFTKGKLFILFTVEFPTKAFSEAQVREI